jgi:hypothetical protein
MCSHKIPEINSDEICILLFKNFRKKVLWIHIEKKNSLQTFNEELYDESDMHIRSKVLTLSHLYTKMIIR